MKTLVYVLALFFCAEICLSKQRFSSVVSFFQRFEAREIAGISAKFVLISLQQKISGGIFIASQKFVHFLNISQAFSCNFNSIHFPNIAKETAKLLASCFLKIVKETGWSQR